MEFNLWHYNLIHLISIPGETNPTDEKLQTAVVERRSTAETELDLQTESLGKIIDIIQTIKQFCQLIYNWDTMYF